MATVAAFHSKKQGTRNVHHDNDKCTEGNNIEAYNKTSGTGGRPKCEHCAKLAGK
jgi:phenylacetate-coenzyme A ligase PaaK-like adenylate-forming protein